jgi:hypothetical protein
MNWEMALQQEGARWRAASSAGAQDVERLLRGTMARLGGSGLRAEEALALLGHLLEPLCGSSGAASAMATAARQCGGVSRRTWPRFVTSLSELIGSFCGLAAGQLVGQAGHSLEVA